jgi:hypothetical protein
MLLKSDSALLLSLLWWWCKLHVICLGEHNNPLHSVIVYGDNKYRPMLEITNYWETARTAV